jgi:hypothetical protein
MAVAAVTIAAVTVSSVAVSSVAATMIIVMATTMQVVVTGRDVEMVPMSVDLGWVPIVVGCVMEVVVSTVASTTVIATGLVAMTTVLTMPDIDVDTATSEVKAKRAGGFYLRNSRSSQSEADQDGERRGNFLHLESP